MGSTGVPAPPQVDYVYGTNASIFNKGRLYQVKQSSTVVETYSYDSLGRVTQVVKNLNGSNYTTSYAYNKANELTSITYPSSRVVTQTYDSVGRLSQVSSSGTNYVSSLAYNVAGQVTGFNYGNGVAASFSYSAQRHQLTALSYVKDSTTLLALSYYYSYDANCTGAPSANNGQIHCIKDTTGTQQGGRTVAYTYDHLYRLKTAVTAGSTSYPQWGLSWTYDRYGNRTAQSLDYGSGTTNSVTVSTSTNRITTSGYSYDSNGNMDNDGLNTLVYDAENRVSSINSGATTYSYDAAGLRVKKVTGSTTTVYVFSGAGVIAEYVNGSLDKEYIYSGSALVATHDAGTLKYHHSDHLSIRVTTNTSGGIIAEQGHYPFGESWYQGSGGSKIQFTSYERDSESGNDYAMARYYISRLGRFNVPDFPFIDQHIGNPQSWNMYSYVRNSPIVMVDPTGMAADPEDPEDPGYMFQMEAGNALNTIGLPTCIQCQMPMWMLLDSMLNRAFDRLDDLLRRAAQQGQTITNVTLHVPHSWNITVSAYQMLTITCPNDPSAACSYRDSFTLYANISGLPQSDGTISRQALGILSEAGRLSGPVGELKYIAAWGAASAAGGYALYSSGIIAASYSIEATSIFNISWHASARMAQYGITMNMLNNALRVGELIWNARNATFVWRVWDATLRMFLNVAQDPITGLITTVYLSKK